MKDQILVLVSIVALILSWVAYGKSYRITKKVNGKEHQMSENLKYVVLNIVSNLQAIEAKSTLAERTKKIGMDYSLEVTSLIEIQKSPEYILLLRSIDDSSLKERLDIGLILICSPIQNQDYGRLARSILCDMRDAIDLDKLIKNVSKRYKKKWTPLVVELCEKKRIMRVDDWGEGSSHSGLCNEDTEKKCLEGNAVKSMKDTERYNVMREFFVNLREREGNVDPNVLLWYGVLTNNEECVQQAIKDGANQNITDLEMINKYIDSYEKIFKNKDSKKGNCTINS